MVRSTLALALVCLWGCSSSPTASSMYAEKCMLACSSSANTPCANADQSQCQHQCEQGLDGLAIACAQCLAEHSYWAWSTCTCSSAETCQQSICPAGSGSYQFCSTQGATSCRYVTQDGTSFACASCSDCTDASQAISTWCGGGTPAGGTNGPPAGSVGGQVCQSCPNDSRGCSTVTTCPPAEMCIGFQVAPLSGTPDCDQYCSGM